MSKGRRSFTLLEVMVGLVLIALAAGVVGVRTHAFLEKRRFQSHVDLLASRIQMLQQMAVNRQADFTGALQRRGKKWVFSSSCLEQPGVRTFAPLSLGSFSLWVDQKEVEAVPFEFFSSGEVSPCAHFLFKLDQQERAWRLPEIVHRQAGDGSKKLGPVHPDEVR